MKQDGSKRRHHDKGLPFTAPAVPEERHHAQQDKWLGQENSEFTAALGAIVSAFVEVGFGFAPTQQARRAANDNHRLIALAADCRREAA